MNITAHNITIFLYLCNNNLISFSTGDKLQVCNIDITLINNKYKWDIINNKYLIFTI